MSDFKRGLASAADLDHQFLAHPPGAPAEEKADGISGQQIKDLVLTPPLALGTQIDEPSKPAEDQAVIWNSSGVGTAGLAAAAGDLCMMSTEGGVTTARIIHDHSTGVVIP